VAVSEFSVEAGWRPDRRSAGRWLMSHALRHRGYILGVLLGAAGNAVLAAAAPVFVGRAFGGLDREAYDRGYSDRELVRRIW
jgi:ATP-binding cassette, subfamily B, bacterial